MSRSLVLAERPFRDLRSRALLGHAAATLGDGPTPLLAMHNPGPVPGFAPVEAEPDLAALEVTRVVLAGAFVERPMLDWALGVAARAQAAGCAIATAGFSVDGAAAAPSPPPSGIGALAAAAPLAARDHRTADLLMLWGVAPVPRLDPYPERAVAPDPALAQGLPAGPVLGVALLGSAEARRGLARDGAALGAWLAPLGGVPVLPLPAEMPGGPTDEWPLARDLAALLPGSALLLPEMSEPAWRRRNLTLPRLRGLVARCALVIASNDLPAALAIAAGVPVIGLGFGAERRIRSCLATLADALPPGSDLVFPERLRAGSRLQPPACVLAAP